MVDAPTLISAFPTLLVLLSEGLFLLTILLHLARKNRSLVWLYAAHSLVLALILLVTSLQHNDPGLLVVVVLTLLIKVGLAYQYFGRLLRSNLLASASGSYLTLPLTLLGIIGITAFAHSERFQFLFATEPSVAASLALASTLIAFFLTINRQGALSQIIGVLALENGIIAFATFLGLKQSLLIEVGLAFDLAVWIIVAAVFVNMVQEQFGSIATTQMETLKEE